MFAHQIGVSRLNKDFDLDGALVLGEHIALDLANLDLFVEHRTATVQRAKAVSLEGQVQAGNGIRQGRLLRQGLELAHRLAIGRADCDVVTGNQGFKTGNTGQRHTWLDQPETGIGLEVLLDVFIHLDRGNHSLAWAGLVQGQSLDLTHRHAFVNHFGLVGDDAFATLEAHLNIDAGFTVGTPSQPATNDQGNEREDPDRRPIGSRAGFSGRQVTHGRRPTPYYPK